MVRSSLPRWSSCASRSLYTQAHFDFVLEGIASRCEGYGSSRSRRFSAISPLGSHRCSELPRPTIVLRARARVARSRRRFAVRQRSIQREPRPNATPAIGETARHYYRRRCHMARSLVVCPATESLELIDFAKSPLGVLIHGCSRFRPPSSLVCSRACAQNGRCDLGTSESASDDDGGDTDIDINIDALPKFVSGSIEQAP